MSRPTSDEGSGEGGDTSTDTKRTTDDMDDLMGPE